MAGKKAVVASMLALILSAGPVFAQETAITIELNDAANAENACRLVFVAVNRSGVLLEKTSYDVVTFDTSGKVGKSLTFQFGRLPIGKTKVVQFDLPGQTCDSISRLLVNDVSECSVDGKASDICIDALTTTTRAKIEFGL
jgi:curli biogenesis system outer membrane secretion channel CsgG